MANLMFFLVIRCICNLGNKLDKSGVGWGGKYRKKLNNRVVTISFLLVTSLLVDLSFGFEIGVNSDLASLKYLAAY